MNTRNLSVATRHLMGPSALALAAAAASPRPRGFAGRVHAQKRPEEIIAGLNASFEEFKKKYDGRHDEIEAALDDQAKAVATFRLNGPAVEASDRRVGPAPDPEYSKTFASYFRTGHDENNLRAANAEGRRAQIRAAMSTGPDQNGGFLAPVEWDRQINKALLTQSPMRRLARVIPTSVRAYSTLYQSGGWGTGWVGETAERPATSTPTLASLVFPNGEIYANPMVSQQLLDDEDYGIENWLADEVEDTFATQESIAFISGNGVNKPRGLLTYVPGGLSADHHPGGNLVTVASGAASTLGDADKLIDFVYGLPARYRQNAKWLMNSMTAATIAKMKDGDGKYLWRETYVAGQPATLLGYAVEIDENMPDIGAGTLPIAFGDFKRGYVINDRLGTTVLRDPFTAKPFVLFYTRKRVGGGVDDPKAIRLLRIAAS